MIEKRGFRRAFLNKKLLSNYWDMQSKFVDLTRKKTTIKKSKPANADYTTYLYFFNVKNGHS